MTTLQHILNDPRVRKRLRIVRRVTSRGTKRLREQMAERERLMDVLERVGLGRHAVENIYPPPLDPYEEDK